jgi:hypothetical protein
MASSSHATPTSTARFLRTCGDGALAADGRVGSQTWPVSVTRLGIDPPTFVRVVRYDPRWDELTVVAEGSL